MFDKVFYCFLSSISLDFNANTNNMAKRTLREIVAPNVVIQTLCIQYPDLDV